jgi:RNA polymerase sigma factor (sigma-70 family)
MLQAGDLEAAQPLWERYFGRLVGLARRRLQKVPRARNDAEDVALSAFASFWRAAKAGRFPRLDDRDGLWRLLLTITARKATKVLRKRLPDLAAEPALEQLRSREPGPELAAEVADECEHLLQILDDQGLQEVAVWRLEGYTVEEIAERRRCSAMSVKRKLRAIRRLWTEAGP